MPQVTLGPLLGGWREVISDHRGRAVIAEPMEQPVTKTADVLKTPPPPITIAAPRDDVQRLLAAYSVLEPGENKLMLEFVGMEREIAMLRRHT